RAWRIAGPPFYRQPPLRSCTLILKNNADLAGGFILLVLGVATTAYTLAYYHLGTLSRMGPGMFPLILGVLIAGLGLLILLTAIWRPVPIPQIRWRETTAIIVAILAFAALIEPAGFVPAVVALNVIS